MSSTSNRGSFNQVRDLDAAKEYDRERFDKSPRMKRLDAWERSFASIVYGHAGASEAEILDMPCGNGRFYDIFREAKRLHLMDYAPTMLEALVAKHPDAARWEPRQGDIMNIPLEDGSVDLAFSMRLFHHIDEPEKRQRALSELARVSKRFVAISIYDTASWRYIRKRLRGKTPSGYAVSLSTLKAEAAEVRLRLVFKYPTISFIEQQRCLLFQKTDSSEAYGAPES